MKKDIDIIKKIPAFGGLSNEQLLNIRDLAVQREFQKNELIFSEGDEASGFYMVVSGRVKIFKLSPEGKEKILHIFGPGEPFGEVAVFAGRSFPANAEAISACRLLFFPKKDFAALIQRQPSIAMTILAVLSERLRHFTVQIENLSLKEVPGRLASYLLVLAREQKRSKAVTLPISKGQLASLLGTIPETLSRIFAKMQHQELIEVKGRQIRITDLEGLEELSEQGKLND